MAPPPSAGLRLRRELGVVGATLLGLGSIVGTGVFVSIGVAAGVAGPAVLLAILAAAFVALCNALSSAQLAAAHPVSGGTYEYGYEYLHPALGFTAGWMFLCAKSTSAATAALGFAGYLLHATGWGREAGSRGAEAAGGTWDLRLVIVAASTSLLLTLLVVGGMRRSKLANAAIVTVTFLALTAFVAAGLPVLLERGTAHLHPFFQPVSPAAEATTGAGRGAGAEGGDAGASRALAAASSRVPGGAAAASDGRPGSEGNRSGTGSGGKDGATEGGGAGDEGRSPLAGLLYACALMFVAYTGYGRIATLGEEVRQPARTIPRAIVATLVVTSLLYAAVGLVAVGVAGAPALAAATAGDAAPLEGVARTARLGVFGLPIHRLVAVGAMTAMLGVLLNLVLGLSRVALAMGRRGDLPAAAARLDDAGKTPWVSVLAVGAVLTALTFLGDVELTWSFSAFTVLVYYALTNLAALRLPETDRRYPRFFPWAGLAACLFLAFWVDAAVWGAGLGLIVAGLGWHLGRRRHGRRHRHGAPGGGGA